MATLTALGARRLRTLMNLGEINLAPITVLLGRNSVGKSTYARLLPLLRQSAERKKRAPILWYDDLVDFGGFRESVTRGQSTIEFLFTLSNLRREGRLSAAHLNPDTGTPLDINLPQARIILTLAATADDETYASELKIILGNYNVCIKFKPDNVVDSIAFNGIDQPWDKSKNMLISHQGVILPHIIFAAKKKPDEGEWFVNRNIWRHSLIGFLYTMVHGNTSRGTIAKIASRLPFSDEENFCITAQKAGGPISWLAIRGNVKPGSSYTKGLMRGLIMGNLDSLIELIDESLDKIMSGVRYLKPIRATAERHYRRVDLSVSEIDPEGRNLPIFLDSLPKHLLASFRSWLVSYLGIDVEPQRQGAQIVLMAKGPDDDQYSNVADMGFGISQVLPIAAQLWASTNAELSRTNQSSFIVIEQPELHLHPAFQANLANLFAGVANTRRNSEKEQNFPKVIIETHSPNLVYRLGALIEQGSLKPSDVSIVLFEPDKVNLGTSTARTATFDERGVLQNWPFGFFEPEQ